MTQAKTTKSFGPPLRLKMVCPKTGKESLRYNAYIERGEFVPLTGGNLYHINAEYSCHFEHEPVACQSSGLTDAEGKEMFFGDVLKDRDGDLFLVDWSVDYGGVLARYLFVNGQEVLSEDRTFGAMPKLVRTCHIIGNRWEPLEALSARVGEARNA